MTLALERLVAGAAALVLTLTLPVAHAAQGGLNFGSGDSDRPIEVSADNGIEWEQEKKIFTARGNAVAIQGDLTVKSDMLRAFYRPKPSGGGTDIFRLDANGSVRITSPGETATGDNAVYDMDKAVMVLSGKNVRYATAEDEITADRQIEYWEEKQMAVARGNAVAVRQDRRIRADTLIAYFRTPTKGNESKVERVEAYDNVKIVTQTETIVASKGNYVPNTGIATLEGAVKITRGKNEMDSCRAEVNMKTGISKMLSCGPNDRSRVRGILVPESRNGK
jgi:lipopolysaccharide export system protein LptA